MSSLRNAVKRITHKERSQPRARSHLGILEKKKDYKQRAVDYHAKQDKLRALQHKAAMKNPDEFYFGMHNSQVSDGKHRKTQKALQKEQEDEIGPAAVAVMKEQDLSYVRMQRQKDLKKMERLQSSLHHLEGGRAVTATALSKSSKRKHTVFVETAEEAKRFDVAEHFETVPELAGRSFNRIRKADLEKAARKELGMSNNGDDGEDDDDDLYSGDGTKKAKFTLDDLKDKKKAEKKTTKKLAKARNAAYRELEQRAKRVRTLERAEAHLVTEKLVASKGRKRKIKEAEKGKPAVYKWRRKRSK